MGLAAAVKPAGRDPALAGSLLLARLQAPGGFLCFDAAAGRVRPLAIRLRKATEVAWTSDGSKAAYAAAMDTGIVRLHVLRLSDGSDRVVASSSDAFYAPAWSSDGKRLVFSYAPRRDLPPVLFVVGSNGAARRQLTKLPPDLALGDGQAAWSPDDSSVAFVRRTRTATSLVVLHLRKRTLRTLVSVPLRTSVRIVHPAWSPRGSPIAFTGTKGIETIAADGTSHRVVVASPPYATSPVWAPDGTALAFARRDDRTDATTSRTHVVDVDRRGVPTGTPRRLPLEIANAPLQWVRSGG